MRRLYCIIGRVAAALALLWLGGFAWFLASGLWLDREPGTATDAIVVLTGGRLRVEAGIELLASGKARKLFISGVNQRVERGDLLRNIGPVPSEAAAQIVLGHGADNTFGNAQETAQWLREEGYRSLLLVTSWYHMPRSRLEFERAMPEARIVPHPVFSGGLHLESWWSWHGAPLIVLGEYHKYLAVWLRPVLGPLVPHPALSRAAALRPPPGGSAADRVR